MTVFLQLHLTEIFALSNAAICEYYSVSEKDYSFSNVTSFIFDNNTTIPGNQFAMFHEFTINVLINKDDDRLHPSNLGEFLNGLIYLVTSKFNDEIHNLEYKKSFIDGFSYLSIHPNSLRMVIYSPTYGFPMLLTVIENNKFLDIILSLSVAYEKTPPSNINPCSNPFADFNR